MPEERVRNVGVVYDGNLYNSYLLTDENNVLIDTVPKNCSGELIDNIKKVLNGKSLDYIILNHTEQDRAGAIERIMNEYPDAVIVATVAGLKNIQQQLNRNFGQEVAKSNAVFRLGDNVTLKFVITHNINWPDSMMTYYIEKKALFSCDAFSKVKGENGFWRYYEENLSPMRGYVYQAIQTISEIEIDTIYPACGIAETEPKKAIEKYLLWSSEEKKDRKQFVVIYQSVSGNTEKMAEKAVKLLRGLNVEAELIDADTVPKHKALNAVYESDGVIFGTPTVYRNIPKALLEVVTMLNHYEMAEKKFAAFGSFGWSGEAANLIYSYLRARHFVTYKAPFRFMFSPTDEEISEFEKYIKGFYEAVIR